MPFSKLSAKSPVGIATSPRISTDSGIADCAEAVPVAPSTERAARTNVAFFIISPQ
jgi:hypothetical protein